MLIILKDFLPLTCLSYHRVQTCDYTHLLYGYGFPAHQHTGLLYNNELHDLISWRMCAAHIDGNWEWDLRASVSEEKNDSVKWSILNHQHTGLLYNNKLNGLIASRMCGAHIDGNWEWDLRVSASVEKNDSVKLEHIESTCFQILYNKNTATACYLTFSFWIPANRYFGKQWRPRCCKSIFSQSQKWHFDEERALEAKRWYGSFWNLSITIWC